MLLMMVKRVTSKFPRAKLKALDILHSVVQSGSSVAPLYGKVLQGPRQPKIFHKCVGRGVIYGNLECAPNGSYFTHHGSHRQGAAISHEIMNGGKHFISNK